MVKNQVHVSKKQLMLQSSNPFQIVSNHFYTGEYGAITKPGSMVVLASRLPEHYQYMVGVLEESLNTRFENLGLAKLNNGQVFHCLAYFGIKINDAGESVMGLQIGYDSDNWSSVFLPCGVSKSEKVVGNNKKIISYDYTLNGWKIDLIRPNLESDKYYIHLTVYDTPKPYIDENGVEQMEDELDEADARFEYSFPFLLSKDSKEDVKKLWNTGKFQECLREFGKFKIYSQANKLFTSLFESNKFPKEGVAFICHNGAKRIALAGSHPKITKDIYSSNWEIAATSHPELLVNVGTDVISLGDVTDIQFTNANNGNEGYKFLENVDGVHKDYVVIHFVTKNSKNPAHMPVNVVAVHPTHILQILEKFPTLVETANKYLTLPSSNVTNKPPKTAKLVEIVEDEELDDILF